MDSRVSARVTQVARAFIRVTMDYPKREQRVAYLRTHEFPRSVQLGQQVRLQFYRDEQRFSWRIV